MNTENTLENGNDNPAQTRPVALPEPGLPGSHQPGFDGVSPCQKIAPPEPGLPGSHSRTGKIARLPQALRQELNQRLQDGQPQEALALWLNGLPEVQAVLADQFKGQPISQENISRWKQGGYLDWQQQQHRIGAVADLFEKTGSLPTATQDGLTERMALMLAANMAVEINRLDSVPDEKQKSKRSRKLLGGLAVLRRGEFHGQRLQVEREKLDLRRDRLQKERQEEFWQWALQQENKDQILERLLTPEQCDEEIARRNAEKQRRIKEILGVR